MSCGEFNNNSTPIQKVQLFYSTIQNDETEKPSNINTLWNIRKRYKTGISELITRRSQVQVLPPQPEKYPEWIIPGTFYYFSRGLNFGFLTLF